MSESELDQVLNPEDMSRVIQRYQQRIVEHGVTFASLNSGNLEKLRMRHQIHSSALIGAGSRLLDIGCGLGHFYQYLQEQEQVCRYTGYDIVPEYITECRQKYPEARFQLRDVFTEGIDNTYDTIVMSQVLNNRYQKSDNFEVMKAAISLAFKHTQISVSIDMMSSYVDFQIPELFYYSPEEIFRFAKSLTRRVVLRHDYRPFEFCVQLFHGDVGNYVP